MAGLSSWIPLKLRKKILFLRVLCRGERHGLRNSIVTTFIATTDKLASAIAFNHIQGHIVVQHLV
jgi:hypothetical protein